MESSISYSEQNNDLKVRQPGRFMGIGCLLTIIILVILVLVSTFVVYPALTPNTLHGKFIDVALVPPTNNHINLWILTDGSFNYGISTQDSNGYSFDTKCLFCSLWLYKYDPVDGKVLKKIKLEQKDITIGAHIFTRPNEVWVFNRPFHENPVGIYVFNVDTGESILDSKTIAERYPTLSSGINDLYVDSTSPPTIRFITRDGGENQKLDVESGTLASQSEYNEKVGKGNSTTTGMFVLKSKNGESKQFLYYSRGSDDDSELFFHPENFEKLARGRGFIDGLILYQDSESCVVLHQEFAGDDSDRLLTRVDKEGNVLWDIKQSDLFKKARVDKKDDFSSMFFMKDKFSGLMQNDVFVFRLEGSGVMGFDFKTGKKAWEIKF